MAELMQETLAPRRPGRAAQREGGQMYGRGHGARAVVAQVRRALGETEEGSKHGTRRKLRSCSEMMGEESPRSFPGFVEKNHSGRPPISTWILYCSFGQWGRACLANFTVQKVT